MAKIIIRKSGQLNSTSRKEKKYEPTQGSLGALLTGALREKKDQQKQVRKTVQQPFVDHKEIRSTTADKVLLQEFEKMASQSQQRVPDKKPQQPGASAQKEVASRKTVFESAGKKTPVKVDRQVHRLPSNKFQSAPKNTQKKEPIPSLTKVSNKPVTLDLLEKQQEKTNGSSVPSIPHDFLGCRAQAYTNLPENDIESDIIIGIDFGTSSTKVVVRDMVLNHAYAVPFSKYAPQENCYLLPTAVSVNQDGTLTLNPGDLTETALKIRFINNDSDIVIQSPSGDISLNVTELFVGYLALALREIRSWFFEQTQQQYAKTEIQWHINVGIPSENYDDTRLRQRFELATQIAWYASVQQQPVDIRLIKYSFMEIEATNRQFDLQNNSVLDDAHLHHSYFSTHPEVVMEVVGYVKSPLGEQGTHLLIDVGASTLDVASFRVGQRDGENIYPMLSCKVAQLGSGMLHRKRMEMIKLKLEVAINNIYAVEPIQPLPAVSEYKIGLCENDLEEHDVKFHAECRKVIGDVVRDTKLNRDAYSEVWTSKLPVFVCGGGSKEKIYKEIVQTISKSLSDALMGFQGFKVLDIPKPETLQAPSIAPNEYRRLAVAYGLSFSNDEIGEIIPQSAVEDNGLTRRIVEYADRFVGPEQM
ncbi:MAG: hypothetical protein PHZ02_02890 [Desulfocapsaceae bacterium]|nr:hypothetical protein [Desulfocapsaceae bacterium]